MSTRPTSKVKKVREKVKAARVLDYIAKHQEGLRPVQIHEFVVRMNGLNWDEFQERTEERPPLKDGVAREPVKRQVRRYRSYWCDFLYGGSYGEKKSLLYRFCTKIGNRWVFTSLRSSGYIMSLDGIYRLKIWRNRGSRRKEGTIVKQDQAKVEVAVL